jgi:tricorn protease
MESMRYWLLLLTALTVSAEEHPLWLRYPAISPNGQTIAFEW